MAIDTAEKRRSARYVTSRRSPAVTPNSAKDVEWRQESGWGYSGILPDGAAAFVEKYITILRRRRR